MSQRYRYAFSELATQRLSPSRLCATIIKQMGRQPGGVALYLDNDEFALTFMGSALNAEETETLNEIIQAHIGDGPDTILDKAARMEAERLAAEAAAAEEEK